MAWTNAALRWHQKRSGDRELGEGSSLDRVAAVETAIPKP
jgi:hypothetical protein